MKIFAEQDLYAVLEGRLQQVKQEVFSAGSDYLLNTNETQYVEYLASRYRIEPVAIDFEGVSVSTREEMVPAERFPNAFEFNIERGRRYPKQVITYHLPFSGNAELLRCKPSSRILWTMEVRLEQGAVCFDVVNWRGETDSIKREADQIIGSIRQQAGNVASEVAGFNNRLAGEAPRIVQARKAELLKQANLLGALGVPIKKVDQVPSTFAVPVAKKSLVITKPAASVGPFKPEPTLNPELYQDILGIISDAGVEMERHPSIYSDKDEETLRDHFLMVLSPHFQSATGETFNKKGKTDILIRHEKANVFVAECKFWSGIKAFHKTIDQLLGYLTWRDSKAAVVSFVRNKELTPVLEAIEKETPSHACFVKSQGKKRDGWFMFEFHLPGDSGRSVQLAVLVFHFP